jgi:hypothetical protein
LWSELFSLAIGSAGWPDDTCGEIVSVLTVLLVASGGYRYQFNSSRKRFSVTMVTDAKPVPCVPFSWMVANLDLIGSKE